MRAVGLLPFDATEVNNDRPPEQRPRAPRMGRPRKTTGRGFGPQGRHPPEVIALWAIYFTSTEAPASSSSCLSLSASSRSMPSLTGLGASSTSALASLRPRPVAARTTLMTWIFLSPAPVRMTSTVDDSSSAAPASPPPPAGGGGAPGGGGPPDSPPSPLVW